MSGWGWGVMGLRERGDIQNRKAGQVHWEEMWTDGTVSIEREREKDREATVISRVAALVNVAMSTFRSDTGADGQFAPVSALAVLPHECSAGALQTAIESHQARHVRYQTKERCRHIATQTEYTDFYHTGGWK